MCKMNPDQGISTFEVLSKTKVSEMYIEACVKVWKLYD